MDIEKTLDEIGEKVDRVLAHIEADVSDSLRPSPETEAAQQASAEELAPPTRPEALAPSGEPQPEPVVASPAEGLSVPNQPEPEPEPEHESQTLSGSVTSEITLSDGSAVGDDAPTASEPESAPASPLDPQAPGDQPIVAPVPEVDNDPASPNPTQPAPTEQPVSPGEQTPAQGGQS